MSIHRNIWCESRVHDLPPGIVIKALRYLFFNTIDFGLTFIFKVIYTMKVWIKFRKI